MARWVIAAAVGMGGIAVGAFSLTVARGDPGYWFADTSVAAGVAFLVAGWMLMGVGAAAWIRRPDSRFGLLLAASGFAWFVLEWNNPGVGSSLAFTIGLCLYAACPPLAGHAVFAYPGGRVGSRLERGALAVAYVGGVLVLGVLPALFRDPEAGGCNQCPRNLVLVSDRGALAEDITRAGVYLGLAWASGLSLLAFWRLVRARGAARPVFAAGGTYLALVAAWFAASLEAGDLSNGTFERRLWFGQAIALVGIALGVGWVWVRSRRARSEVARLVVDLAQAPAPGRLRDVLAEIVGDPELVLAYPAGEPSRLVDAQGRSVQLSETLEQTPLVHDGRAVAVLAHAPGLLADEELVAEVGAASRLALENERLQAEVRARLEELRASRARIVEAGDAERKRLERNLHDGAQQRLVALSLSLQLLRSRLPADPALDEAGDELRAATAELRELAHGIFPTVLADEGLAAAVEALAEDGHATMRIRELPEGRFSLPIETAAYTVVAEAAKAATGALDVRAEHSDGALVVEVDAKGFGDSFALIELGDRVGAVDGTLAFSNAEDGGSTIRAVLPCGS